MTEGTIKGEILPPEAVADNGPRDEAGRFGEGNKFGQGRQPGVANKTTMEMRQMVIDALHMAGGVEYLAMMAYTNSTAFIGLVGKTLPIKVDLETQAVQMRYIKHDYADQPSARADRPRPPSAK